MNPRKLKFGDVTVLIIPTEPSTAPAGKKGLKETSSASLASLTKTIREVAKSVGDEMRQVAEEVSPHGVEIEFKFGLSEESNWWFINVKGEQAITVKMKWEFKP